MNNYKNLLILFGFLFLISALEGFAQKKQKKGKTMTVSLSFQVVDESGNAIPDAFVLTSRKRTSTNAEKNGNIRIKTVGDDILIVKASGFESKYIRLTEERPNDKVVLVQALPFTGENHQLYTPFGQMSERRSVGAYSKVQGKFLEQTPGMSIQSSLGGRLNGLFQLQNTLVPGWTDHTMYVRGGWGGYITIVDGVERTLEYLEPEVIESVELLKDATLKSLYGGGMANGILLITTRKGKAHENSVRVNVEQGIQMPARLPDYLNAFEYASYYNQAMVNDGFEPMYDDVALNAYKNHTDPYLYPDVDYYDMFLNKSFQMSRVNAQISGGNESNRYFAHIGYQGNGGLEKFTDYPNADDIFTVRTSVEMDLAGFITFDAGFNGALQTKQWPNISTQNFFAPLRSHHANDYPILIPGSMVGRPQEAFVPGGTSEKQNNPYGLLTGRGYAERKYSYIQSDFELNFNLDEWVPGLSVKPYVSFDVYNVVTATQGATFSVYEPVAGVSGATGNDTVTFSQWGSDTRETKQSRTGADVTRNVAVGVTANYNRQWGNHSFKGLLNFFQSKKEIRDIHESPRRQNLGIHLSDMFLDKYILELNVNRVGVTSFAPGNRYGYFPAFGAGWILSEEDFMPETSFLDYLKLRASYGILGSTIYSGNGAFATHLYQDVWVNIGTINLDGSNYRIGLDRTGNPNLDFQKSYEFNVGFDAMMFERSLQLSLGYFYNIFGDLMTTRSGSLPGVTGLNEALPYVNYSKYGLRGMEGELSYSGTLGDLNFYASANATYGVNWRIIYDEPNYPDASFDGLRQTGRTIGNILGLEAIGVFADQADIDQSPLQVYGPVRPGDIKYADINNDEVVDDRDRKDIGNSSPRLQYGISVGVDYKGFNLDLLGVGYGKYRRMLNTGYYQIYGSRKYSRVVTDGLPNGNPHPKLSVTSIQNNFVSSTYWMINSAFFKLRNVELGYTLPQNLTQKIGINKVKIFTRGHNLMTLSRIKDLDPESLDAGVENFPLGSTVTMGVSVSF